MGWIGFRVHEMYPMLLTIILK